MKNIIVHCKKCNKNMLLILSSILITLQTAPLEAMESLPAQQVNNKEENNNSNYFIPNPLLPNTLHKSTLGVWDYFINTVKSNEATGKFVSLLIDRHNVDEYNKNYLNYFKEYTVDDQNLLKNILSNKKVTRLIEKLRSNTTFITENKSFAQFVKAIIENKNTDNTSILQRQEYVNKFIMIMEDFGLLLYFFIMNCNNKDEYYDFIRLLQNDYIREILKTRNMQDIMQNMQWVQNSKTKLSPQFSNNSIFTDNNIRNTIISELNNIYCENKKLLKHDNSILESIEEKDDEYENSTNSFIQMLKDHDSLMDYFEKNNNKQEYYQFIDNLKNKEIKNTLINHNNKDEIINNIIDTLQSLGKDNLYGAMQEEITRSLFE